MFDRAVDAFLPELFRRWQESGTRHRVTAVLFTRVKQEDHLATPSNDPLPGNVSRVLQRNVPGLVRDYYHVLVDDASSAHGDLILNKLKDQSQVFLRDVSTHAPFPENGGPTTAPKKSPFPEDGVKGTVIGQPMPASAGNLLEAINLSCSHFSENPSGCQLARTGLSMIVVTPGNGVFDVDFDLLYITGDRLATAEASVSLVCLSDMPLHIVPLCRYRLPHLSEPEAAWSCPPHENPPVLSQNSSGPGRSLAQIGAVSPSNPRSKDGFHPGHTHNAREPTHGQSGGVPHWLDASFWRAPGKSPGTGPNKARSHYPASGGPYFFPSVRMNEVQMTGGMETEMSHISVPMLSQCKLHCTSLDSFKYSTDAGTRMPFVDGIAENNVWRVPQSPNKGLASINANRTGLAETCAESGLNDSVQYMDEYDQLPFSFDETLGSSEAPSKGATQVNEAKERGASWAARDYQETGKPPMRRAASQTNQQMPLLTERVTGRAGANRDRASDLSQPRDPPVRQTAQQTQKARFGPHGFGPGAAKAAPITELSPEVAYPKANSVSGLGPVSPGALRQEEVGSNSMNKAAKSPEQAPGRPRTSDKDVPQWSTDRLPRSVTIRSMLSGRSVPNVFEAEESSSGEGRHKHAPSNLDEAALLLTQMQGMIPGFTHLNPCATESLRKLQTHMGKRHNDHSMPLFTTALKWKSLCFPACGPPRSGRPLLATQSQEHEIMDYTIRRRLGGNEADATLRVRDGVRKIVEFRMNMGFQAIPGPGLSQALHAEPTKAHNHVSEEIFGSRENEIVFIRGRTAHKINFGQQDGSLVEIRVQQQRIGAFDSSRIRDPMEYQAFIRTSSSTCYRSRRTVIDRSRHNFDWRQMDELLLDSTELSHNASRLGFRTARYVLVPNKGAFQAAKPLGMEKDNDEEIRLEAINKLTHVWQKNQHVPWSGGSTEGVAQVQQKFNKLDITYRTRHPSAVVAAELNDLFLTERWQIDREEAAADQFQRSTYDLSILARAMQGDQGIHFVDRWWHLTLYRNCFVGIHLTTWLLKSFPDLKSREEAVTLGNELMRRGLFVHVRGKHEFRDGNFFYHMARPYALPSADSKKRWFGRVSSPSTPAEEHINDSSPEPNTARPSTRGNQEVGGHEVPERTKPKQSIKLSKAMMYNVDHRRRSDRQELVLLHYDRISSADDCYHLRVDWVDARPKLIQDVLESWAILIERLGLNLVRLPVPEASALIKHMPFADSCVIKLARNPAETPEKRLPLGRMEDPSGPIQTSNWKHHEAILKKFGFALDFEAARDFPEDVSITYSWGHPDYRFTQYVSRDGGVLAQITDEGEFLLLVNPYFESRESTGLLAGSGRQHRGRGQDTKLRTARSNALEAEPLSQEGVPNAYSTGNAMEGEAGHATITHPLATIAELRAFCSDAHALQEFYDQAAVTQGIERLLSPAIPEGPQATDAFN